MPLHIVIAWAAVLEYEGTDKKIFPRSAIFPIVLFCRRVLGGKTTMDENAKTKKKSVEEMVKDLDTKIEREEEFLQKAEKTLVDTKEKIKEALIK